MPVIRVSSGPEPASLADELTAVLFDQVRLA